MTKKTWVAVAIAVVATLVAAPKLRQLPVLNKLPTV